MFQQDYLLRQIRELTQALVQRAVGQRPEVEHVEAACQGATGLNLDVAMQLSAETLLSLLTTADGLDGVRCLTLGLALGLWSRVADGAERDAIAERAVVLIEAALTTRPELMDADTLEALRLLQEGQ
jgi:hypothetical protein